MVIFHYINFSGLLLPIISPRSFYMKKGKVGTAGSFVNLDSCPKTAKDKAARMVSETF